MICLLAIIESLFYFSWCKKQHYRKRDLPARFIVHISSHMNFHTYVNFGNIRLFFWRLFVWVIFVWYCWKSRRELRQSINQVAFCAAPGQQHQRSKWLSASTCLHSFPVSDSNTSNEHPRLCSSELGRSPGRPPSLDRWTATGSWLLPVPCSLHVVGFCFQMLSPPCAAFSLADADTQQRSHTLFLQLHRQ